MYLNLLLTSSIFDLFKVAAKLPSWTVDGKADFAKVALTAGAAWATIVLGAGAADLSAGEDVFTNNCGT